MAESQSSFADLEVFAEDGRLYLDNFGDVWRRVFDRRGDQVGKTWLGEIEGGSVLHVITAAEKPIVERWLDQWIDRTPSTRRDDEADFRASKGVFS